LPEALLDGDADPEERAAGHPATGTREIGYTRRDFLEREFWGANEI